MQKHQIRLEMFDQGVFSLFGSLFGKAGDPNEVVQLSAELGALFVEFLVSAKCVAIVSNSARNCIIIDSQ